jgi:hypothetical protein
MAVDCMSDDQWEIYHRVIDACKAAGLEFAVGGGLAIGVYTGLWRETKDIDLYVLPQDREAMIQILSRLGLQDYYDQLSYDRAWIYRSVQDKTIVDVIWAMANHKTEIDERWVKGGPEVTIRGETFRLVPPEEMIWAKLYVVQKDRCDWPDVLNLLYAQRDKLDWGHLLDRLGEDAPILHAALIVFGWLCPTLAEELPKWLWKELQNARPSDSTGEGGRRRAELLDRRPWFGITAGC